MDNLYKFKRCKGQPILHKSFEKHGVDKHIFEILCECIIIDLNNKERYYQDLYSAVGKNGLNCQLVNNDIEKRVFSESAKIKTFSPEHLKKVTDILILINKKRSNRIVSDVTKEKIRLLI